MKQHCRENLRRNTCTLLSRILCVLGKTAFSENTTSFANNLRQGFLELPKDSRQWNNVIARDGKSGTSLMILLYYHFHGTEEYEAIHFSFRYHYVTYFSLLILVLLLEATWYLWSH